MAGGILLVVAMIIALPFVLFAAGACWSALLGGILTSDARARGDASPEAGSAG